MTTGGAADMVQWMECSGSECRAESKSEQSEGSDAKVEPGYASEVRRDATRLDDGR
jgi:hypothetical protein